MNGFAVPSWVIIAVVVAAFVGCIGYSVRLMFQRWVFFKPLRVLGVENVQWAGSTDERFLEKAFTQATLSLERHTIWGTLVPQHLRGTQVIVMGVPTWTNDAGKQIAGDDPSGPWIRVGYSLDALCHELGHQLEERLLGIRNEAHTGWDGRGFTAADAEYQIWLRGRA